MKNLTTLGISEFPRAPVEKAGLVTYRTGTWRSSRPVIDSERCSGCFLCWVFCPDGAVERGEGRATIDYDACKGCGICSRECPRGAIVLKREGEGS